MKLCTIVVANRDHTLEEDILKQVKFLKEEFNAKIEILNMPIIEISSSEIRGKITKGKSVKYYLPPSVLDYIKDNNLYLAH